MAREETIDLMIVSLGSGAFDGLRLCSQARSHERTRNLPILIIADPDDRPKVLRGLELGVNDYLTRPIDRNELLARVRDQHPPEALRGSPAPVRAAIDRDGAVRRADRAQQSPFPRATPAGDDRNRAPRGAPLTMMVLDIDHFKRVNDTYGHDVGDLVLKGFAAQLQDIVRGGDLLCRLGGEEFVVVMPDVDASQAARIAERARQTTESRDIHNQRRDRLRFDYGLDRSRRMAGQLGLRRALSSSGPGALSVEIGGPQSRHSGRGLTGPADAAEIAPV